MVYLVGVVLSSANLARLVATSHDVNATDNLVGYVLNFGILGVFTIAWFTNKIKTAGDVAAAEARVEKAETRAEAAEARERALHDTLRTDVVPAMIQMTAVATRMLDKR